MPTKQLQPKDLLPGDVVVWFKAKQFAHFSLVIGSKTKPIIVHQRSNENQPSKQLCKNDGIIESEIHSPRKARGKKPAQPEYDYVVYRFEKLMVAICASQIVEAWSTLTINYDAKNAQIIEAKKDNPADLNAAEETFTTDGIARAIRYAARHIHLGCPRKPSNGLSCAALVITAYQTAELIKANIMHTRASMEKTHGINATYISDTHPDPQLLKKLEKTLPDYLLSQYKKTNPNTNREQTGWCPSFFYLRPPTKNLHQAANSIKSFRLLPHQPSPADIMATLNQKSGPWQCIGLFKPNTQAYRKQQEHITTEMEKHKQSTQLLRNIRDPNV